MIENSFNEILTCQRKGEFLTEVSRAIQEATQAVREHKKQASVTIKITIAPANGDASAVQVIDEIKVKVPETSNPSTLFYTTDENTLSRKDPNQKEMLLEQVKKPIVLAEPAKAAINE